MGKREEKSHSQPTDTDSVLDATSSSININNIPNDSSSPGEDTDPGNVSPVLNPGERPVSPKPKPKLGAPRNSSSKSAAARDNQRSSSPSEESQNPN